MAEQEKLDAILRRVAQEDRESLPLADWQREIAHKRRLLRRRRITAFAASAAVVVALGGSAGVLLQNGAFAPGQETVPLTEAAVTEAGAAALRTAPTAKAPEWEANDLSEAQAAPFHAAAPTPEAEEAAPDPDPANRNMTEKPAAGLAQAPAAEAADREEACAVEADGEFHAMEAPCAGLGGELPVDEAPVPEPDGAGKNFSVDPGYVACAAPTAMANQGTLARSADDGLTVSLANDQTWNRVDSAIEEHWPLSDTLQVVVRSDHTYLATVDPGEAEEGLLFVFLNADMELNQ